MTNLIDPARLRQMAVAGDSAPNQRRPTLVMQWEIDRSTGRAVSQWVAARRQAQNNPSTSEIPAGTL